jgi:hypothetical protein
MKSELEKDLEGGDCGPIQISHHCSGYAIEDQENFSQDILCPDRNFNQVSNSMELSTTQEMPSCLDTR